VYKSGMKKVLVTILAFVLFCGLTPVASAQKISKVKKVLKPEAGSDIVLDRVEYVKDGDLEHISVEGHAPVDGVTEEFDIDIDPDKGTYKTKRESISQAEEIQLLKKSTLKNNKDITASATTYYYAWVQAVTDDLPGFDLCATKLRLDWVDYGSTIGYNWSQLTPWAANPSAVGTHWYTEWTRNYNHEYLDGYTRIRKKGEAGYYNWDWGYDNQRTDVDHWVVIYANNNGTYNYYIGWSRSGEDASILDLDIRRGSGVY